MILFIEIESSNVPIRTIFFSSFEYHSIILHKLIGGDPNRQPYD